MEGSESTGNPPDPENVAVVATSELNRRLGELLRRVGQGEEIALARYGKVVARLVPPRREETPAAPTKAPPSRKLTPQQQRDALLRGSRRGERAEE